MNREEIPRTVPTVKLYLDTMRRLSRTRGMRWVMSRIQTPLDMRFKGTRFAISKIGASEVPLCYLTAIGRRSGEPRTVPLTYMPMGGSFAVVATNYGREHHPAWALNLEANPEATIEIDGRTFPVTARQARYEELSAIWDRFDRFWPGYEEYRAIAPRDIKVFMLDPTKVS